MARKYKERIDKLWTHDIEAWLRSICPAREHGYKNRQEILDDLNEWFGTSFSLHAFVTHCYESGIQLGFASSNSNIPRGEKHWRHREVGEFQYKKGYLRIKVAEPNKWMQYQRYLWEQAHPGESAEGKVVIFLDGNNRNFSLDNLACITRSEQSLMAEFGCTKDSSRDERELCLLRARLTLAKTSMLGKNKAWRLHQKLKYERIRDDPEFKAKSAAYAKKRMAEIRADLDRNAEFRAKQRAYVAAHRERYNELARLRHAKIKADPERYAAYLEKQKEYRRKKKSVQED